MVLDLLDCSATAKSTPFGAKLVGRQYVFGVGESDSAPDEVNMLSNRLWE
jgi:hypothetical protein